MKKIKLKNLIMITIAAVSLCSCNSNPSETTTQVSDPTTSTTSDTISSSSESTSQNKVVNINEALENTKYYTFKNAESLNNYLEIFLDSFYLNCLNSFGYLIPSESDYIHYVSSSTFDNNDYLDTAIEVYGRAAPKSMYSSLENSTFIKLIGYYESTFEQFAVNSYSSKNSHLISELSDFLQMKYISYANHVELFADGSGRLSDIKIYEISGERKDLIFHGQFKDEEYNNIGLIQRWINDGSIINHRIYDYKNIIKINGKYVSNYEDDSVEFEAVVVAYDENNNLYVANKNAITGNVGIKIKNVNKSYDLGSLVRIKGTVVTENYISSIIPENIEELQGKSSFLPSFDEEMIVHTFGGGKYAAEVYSSSPIYSDSLYSTYGYIEDLPSLNEEEDTIITISCPSQINASQQYFKMDLVLPKYLGSAKKNELYNELKTSIFSPTVGAKEFRFDSFIVRYNTLRTNNVEIIATPNSIIFERPTINDVLNTEFGLTSFPTIDAPIQRACHFGEANDVHLESIYGISEYKVEGYFVEQIKVSQKMFDDFILSLSNLNYLEIDQVLDFYGGRHYLYQYEDIYLDFALSFYNETSFIFTLFIYKGELIKPINVTNKIENSLNLIGISAKDYFLVLENSYDADYKVYSIQSYAGEFYIDKPLTAITYDSNENRFNDFCSSLVKIGYSQYRVNNKVYNYKARGQTHYVFKKDNIMTDVAIYLTSDYSYTGHSDFTYRLEIIMYEGSEPLNVTKYNNLDQFVNLYTSIDERLKYSPTLSSDATVEIWRDFYDYNNTIIEYGYGMRDEAFIYSNTIDEDFEAIKASLEEAGYSLSFSYPNSALFSKTLNNQMYPVFVLKETEKGYIRLMHDLGGIDFYR